MLAVGVLLLAASVLVMTWLRSVYRAPAPPGWATYDTIGNLVAVAITGAIGFGFVAAAMGVIRLLEGRWSPVEVLISLAAIVIVGGVLAVRRRGRPLPGGATGARA